MESRSRQLERYVTSDGKIPFTEWFKSLRDLKVQAKITKRLRRITLGNFGDCKSVGDGVFELRIDSGPGYRIYFGQVGLTIVLLLCGGDKNTQDRDIRQAKKYWQDYRSSENG